MHEEMLCRVRMAAEYQKKAVRALFSEKMNEHIDVIEREVKLMAAEAAVDFFRGCAMKGRKNADGHDGKREWDEKRGDDSRKQEDDSGKGGNCNGTTRTARTKKVEIL